MARVPRREMAGGPGRDYGFAPCAYCEGQGWINTEGVINVLLGGDRCPCCGGKGSHIVLRGSPRCAACRGSGAHERLLSLNPCPSCNGSGWAYTYANRRR